MKYNFNALWTEVKKTWIGRHVWIEKDLPLAQDFLRFMNTPEGRLMAMGVLALPLSGNGYGWESRRSIPAYLEAPITTSGANTSNFNLYDYTTITMIGGCWTTAGTVTAMVADFDAYPRSAVSGTATPGGTVVDKLDATNGVVTSLNTGANLIATTQALGAVLYKDLSNFGIDRNPGTSIQFIVTTTTTAGAIQPFVLGIPKTEVLTNMTTAYVSA